MSYYRLSSVILLITAIQLTVYAGVRGNEASQALVNEGNVLLAKGQFNDALSKYMAASKTDPTASIPISSMAYALLSASRLASGDNAAKLRQQSEAAAHQALLLGTITKNSGKQLTDPALVSMQMFAQADQLESAVLLLLYRESFRPELEAWKKSHTNGVKTFVDVYGLRP